MDYNEELISALREVTPKDSDDGEGLTGAELADKLGWSRDRVMRYLKEFHDGGRLESVRVKREDITGVERTVPAYRLMSEKPEKVSKKKRKVSKRKVSKKKTKKKAK